MTPELLPAPELGDEEAYPVQEPDPLGLVERLRANNVPDEEPEPDDERLVDDPV